jgi:hypothetical protein
MEVVSNSISLLKPGVRKTVAYKMWKQNLHKWDEYVLNRHLTTKKIDPWCQYIVDHCHGDVAVYNSGGMFFTDFIRPITVIEHIPCPITVQGMCYLDNQIDWTNQFDSLIMINPIALKYHHSILEFLTIPGPSRAGKKPRILSWVRDSGSVFLSFSDWHLFYDRLRYTPEQFVNEQINTLEKLGLKLIYKQIEPSNKDIVNGNVKLIFKLSLG